MRRHKWEYQKYGKYTGCPGTNVVTSGLDFWPHTDLKVSHQHVTNRQPWVNKDKWAGKICKLPKDMVLMSVKLGRSHRGRDVGWGCSRIGYWGRYLGERGTNIHGSGEDYKMRSFVICTPHQILFESTRMHHGVLRLIGYKRNVSTTMFITPL